jgi:hypothetical protein
MASSDFTTVFFDDFNGGSVDRSLWRSLYSGEYGNGAFAWTPGQIDVGGGLLEIGIERFGDQWLAGGLSTIPDGQTYGSYEFRARIDEGQGTAGVILLWPSNNTWSDEVDIVETHRGDRDGFAFTNHGNPWETQYIDADVSEWHTYRLEWTPGQLLLSIDGREVSRMTNDVPDQPMSFGMQGHVLADWERWYGGGPDASTPDRVEMQIDWVHVSAWTPGNGDGGGNGGGASSVSAWQAPAWEASTSTNSDGPAEGWNWIDAAQAYIAGDGTWEGSWRNQVATGQISVEEVALRLEAGMGSWEPWA